MPSGPTVFDQTALRMYGTFARGRLTNHPELGSKLAKAGVELVPTAYLASLYLRVTVTSLVGVGLFFLYLILAGGPANADPVLMLATLLSGLIFGIITFSYYMLWPDLKIASRGRDIDGHLPYALNFMAAMSSAGIIPDEVFGALGRQPVYGEIAREANMIHRDTSLFSKDLLQALRDGAARSPSTQLAEFLQGAITTVTSGGDLSTYFMAKSEQFASENHRKHRGFIESMGVMAESYVVVAAAAPLFLIVILSVMLLLSDTDDPTRYLNVIVLLAMPAIHAVFVYILRTMRPA